MRRLSLLHRALAALALLLSAMTSAAAQEPPPRGNSIAATLVAESDAPAPGDGSTLAIAMRPLPGWHGYWSNPGDAGLPLTVEWTLPPGVRVGAPAFPTPDTLVVQGIMNHIYPGAYAVLVPLSVAATVPSGTRLPIRGKARWLSCSDSLCVPEEAMVAVDLVAGDGAVAPARSADFARWRAALPVPLGSPARFARRGDRIEVALPWPAAAEARGLHLFPAAQDLIAHGAEQRFRRSGDWLIASLESLEDARPAAVEGVLRIGGAGGRGIAFRAVPGAVPSGGTAIAGGGAASADGAGGSPFAGGPGGLALLFGAALLGGIILNLMPCVFPILGLKAISLARAGTARGAARRDALAYLAGSLVACLALGGLLLALRAGGAELGWAFQLQDPRVVFLLLLLMVAIGANLAGLFELGALSFGVQPASGGAAGSFATGALAAFVATPCTGPFMAAALGAALVLPWQAALFIFAGLGIGLALPFVLIAYVERLRAALPRPGPWLATFRRLMAAPMLLTALALGWLLWRLTGMEGLLIGAGGAALLLIVLTHIGVKQRGGDGQAGRLWPVGVALAASLALFVPLAGSPAAAADAPLDGEAFSEARLAALTASGKPAFVYFTADWCITCKANEQVALARPEVAEAMERGGVTVLRGDFTRADAGIARFLAASGRSGVPYYLYIDAGGRRIELPQLLTAATVVAAVEGRS